MILSAVQGARAIALPGREEEFRAVVRQLKCSMGLPPPPER
jgi:hypothetical protein